LVTGLTNGTTYGVQVRAVNVIGNGAASSTTSAVPASRALAPSLGSITAGDAQLSISFTPGNNGGSAISNYQYSVDGGDTWVTRSPDATTSPIAITGLTNGTN
jgi:hypothetical protein